MAEFRDEDFDGSTLERVTFRGSELRKVKFDGSRMWHVNFMEIDLRGSAMYRARLRGVEWFDVDISGEFVNVTMNGVEIAPLIEAELNRRTPERAKMRPDTADGFREAWQIIERLWSETIDRARTLPEDALHESVGGEWSFIQTLRHLNFAIAAWVGRMVNGIADPYGPLDIPWDEGVGLPDIPAGDRDARPSLDEVLAVREERHAMVRDTLAALTDEQLASQVSRTEPGWPKMEDFPFKECLLVVLNEEWEHRTFAERDLSGLPGGPPRAGAAG